jgi:hypothetical protein
MMLTVRAGRTTLVQQHICNGPGEVSVRFILPVFLRWLPVGVIVRIETPEHQAAISVQT